MHFANGSMIATVILFTTTQRDHHGLLPPPHSLLPSFPPFSLPPSKLFPSLPPAPPRRCLAQALVIWAMVEGKRPWDTLAGDVAATYRQPPYTPFPLFPA